MRVLFLCRSRVYVTGLETEIFFYQFRFWFQFFFDFDFGIENRFQVLVRNLEV